MKGPCEHCLNPDKSKWLTQCKYKGDFPSRRAFILSTFDPPCACDQYDEDMKDRDLRREVWPFALFVTGATVVCALAFYFR